MKNTVLKWKSAAKNRVRRIAEFGAIHKEPLDSYQDSVRRLYDGPQGAMLHLSSLFSLHDPMMGKLFRSGRFDASRFDRFLDVGSGAGQIVKHLLDTARPDAEIVGFDLSAEMLRRARDRMKSDRPRFVAADMMRLPFRDESFDCITCGYVLEHIPDPFPGLSEFARVLRRGGSALLLVTENSLSGLLTSHTWKCRTFSRQELRDACHNVGLEWDRELWFTRVHEMLRLGGILVEVKKA